MGIETKNVGYRNMETNKSLIVKANELIETPSNLTTFEQRIILYVCSMINRNDDEFQYYTISIPQFRKLVGIAQGYNNQIIKEKLTELLKKVVVIRSKDRNPDGRVILTHWLSSADIDFDRSLIKVTIDPLLKPYLIQLKGNFTSYQLRQVIRFNNKYAFKMYELMKQYERYGVRTISIDDLRYYFGIGEDQYQSHKNFRCRALQPAVDEVNTTDLRLSYEQITSGRRVVAIKFYISKSILGVVNQSLTELIAMLPDEHRSKTTIIDIIRRYYEKSGHDYVSHNIKYANKRSKTNYRYFLYQALENDWGAAMWEDDLAKIQKEQQKQQVLAAIELQNQMQLKDEEDTKRTYMTSFNSLSEADKEVIVLTVAKKYPLSKRLSLDSKLALYYEDHPEELNQGVDYE